MEARGQRFDLAGSVPYTLMIAGAMYGLTLLPSAAGIGWLVVGGIVLAVFVRWERRVPQPLVEVSLFSGNVAFLCSNFAAMINYSAIFAVGFLLSLYLQYVRGLDPAIKGLLLIAQPIVQMVVSPVAGHISDRHAPRVVATLGLGLLTRLGRETSLVYIVASLAVLGLGYGLFSSPNTNAIMSSVEIRRLGIASGMVATMRAVGQMTSLSIAMVFISMLMGNVQITPERYPALLSAVNLAFLFFFALGIAGIRASWVRNGVTAGGHGS